MYHSYVRRYIHTYITYIKQLHISAKIVSTTSVAGGGPCRLWAADQWITVAHEPPPNVCMYYALYMCISIRMCGHCCSEPRSWAPGVCAILSISRLGFDNRMQCNSYETICAIISSAKRAHVVNVAQWKRFIVGSIMYNMYDVLCMYIRLVGSKFVQGSLTVRAQTWSSRSGPRLEEQHALCVFYKWVLSFFFYMYGMIVCNR